MKLISRYESKFFPIEAYIGDKGELYYYSLAADGPSDSKLVLNTASFLYVNTNERSTFYKSVEEWIKSVERQYKIEKLLK